MAKNKSCEVSLYYNYSFCDDITPYSKELKFLDNMITTNEIVIPNAKSLPFSFALSKGRKISVHYCENTIKYFYMLNAFITSKDRYLKHILSYIPFDDNFLNFCLNNNIRMNEWDQAVLFFILNHYSIPVHSFDGPYFGTGKDDKVKKHLSFLASVHKRKFNIVFNQLLEPNKTYLYEFPNPDIDFESGSVVITNRIIPELDLLFEDKLKIYGV
jgi:hypothetical protein